MCGGNLSFDYTIKRNSICDCELLYDLSKSVEVKTSLSAHNDVHPKCQPHQRDELLPMVMQVVIDDQVLE